MAKRIARILLFADSHFSVDSKIEEEKWFPPICSLLSRFSDKMVGKFLKHWDEVTQKRFIKIVRNAYNHGPYNYMLGLGDYTPGANESGMLTPKTIKQYREFENILNRFPDIPRLLIWGDHDVGYRFDVSGKTGVKIGTEQGGVSVASVEAAEKLIGPPFGEMDIGPAKFIYFSTNLVRNVDEGSNPFLKDLKAKQESYVANALWKSQSRLNFLLLHDPTAILPRTAIRKIIDSHHRKITAIVHGHLHAEFSAKLTRAFYKPFRQFCKMYKLILVPAPWGMFGIGGGFLILNLFDDGSYQIKKHKT
ncbi:metallophosphoesterase [bacterium]|nr:metallophosphoesterase [bacterium]